ncbi:ROK family transcriptional regulator [Nonomuraea sp. MCN248]|uniref:ROK family transcriptional regulator n=1 Tax=Nonomuraea corallina TaxID=2989783 RepID=A0ABT4SH39_9ACTN|nr:ROK family transcriptional regulator [Nonomuraea corallina]MDA0636236.1 ROK family transcriptional regulator [Nonomuraea corallina]
MRTATPRTARVINDRLALDLLLEQGPLTAPQLKTLTGLSRPTVSDLIERLQAGGLVEVHGETGGDRRGPNAKLYRIVAGRAHVAGVGVRRDSISATVADLTGVTVGARVREADGDLAGLVAAAVAEAADGRTVDAVAVGLPGVVDPHTGDLLEARMVPGWRPGLLGHLRDLLGAPVLLENEVNLAALAEHREGAAAGCDDFIMLWLDEGVGSAVVLGGRPRRGASGGAGEIGFLGSPLGAICALLTREEVARLDLGELARRVVQAAFPGVAVMDPGLVVLAGDTGREGGRELADLVADGLAALAPVPTEVRVTAVEGDPVVKGAVETALSMARDAVFGTP